MRIFIFSLLFTLSCTLTAQWNKDAGLVPSLLENAKISVSSGENAQNILDNNPNTYWESDNLLPVGYLNKNYLNLFLNKDAFTMSPETSAALAFDGNTDSKAAIAQKKITIRFQQPQSASWAHVKINTSENVTITLTGNKRNKSFVFSPEDNYQIKSLELNSDDPISEITLTCQAPYELFELGMLTGTPVQIIEIDLQKPTSIGWISTRHFNGDGVSKIKLLTSEDGEKWFFISDLNPLATGLIPTLVNPETTARFLRLEFTLLPIPYQKARLMDIAAYDKYGPFGPPPEAVAARKTFAESMGINSFWGWGYSVYSDLLTQQQGPGLFINVAQLARNYHRIDWDIDNPQQQPNFDKRVSATQLSGSQWMNWAREYAVWKKTGFTIDAAITFDKTAFSDKSWKNPEKEAKDYGMALANYFVINKKLIQSVEVGNEPWEYDGAIYRKVLKGMSNGIKSVSPKTPVYPCAIQAFDPSSVLNNYVSRYITDAEAPQIDGLNTHIYSYYYTSDGQHRAINPEDPRSEIWSMNNLIRYRNMNMPGKSIIVTEFGFDSEGGGEDCTHSECISEMEQAMYGTRMALILYRLGAESFYWYYFANVDYQSQMHNRSGLTASYSGGFEPKLSFKAFAQLKTELGELYFKRVVEESPQAYVYAYADKSGVVKKLIAWLPSSTDHMKSTWVDIPWKASSVKATYLIPDENGEIQQAPFSMQINAIRIALTGNPVIITLNE